MNFENIYNKKSCIANTYKIGILFFFVDIVSIYIKFIYKKNAFIKSFKLKILTKLEIILINPKINK